MKLHQHSQPISQHDPVEVLRLLHQEGVPHFLYESKSVNPLYGRMSLLGVDPTIEVEMQETSVALRLLNTRGKKMFELFVETLKKYVDHYEHINDEFLIVWIEKGEQPANELERTKRRCIAQVIPQLIATIDAEENDLCGLYGAAAHDFAHQFEDIEHVPNINVPVAHYYVFDSFVRFDVLKEKTTIVTYAEDKKNAEELGSQIYQKMNCHPGRLNFLRGTSNQNDADPGSPEEDQSFDYQVSDFTVDLDRTEFEKLVAVAKGATRADPL